MNRRREKIAIGTIAAGITMTVLGFTPAHADFFSLDGRFQCLDRKEAVCGDARPVTPPSITVTKPAAVQPQPEAGPELLSLPRPNPQPQSAAQHAAEPALPADPLHAIAKRVQQGESNADDIAWLRQAARAENAHAVELLAWCELHGIGMPSDPIEAYILYGVAASNGVPHARNNQTLVYEQNLTSEQRQHLLDMTYNGTAVADIR